MSADLTVERDGSVIYRVSVDEGRPRLLFVDQPSAGSHTYTVKVGRTPQGGIGSVTGDVGDRMMLLTILKV